MSVYSRCRRATTGALLLMLGAVATAELATIERCAEAASTEARIECLEDTVRQLSPAETSVPEAVHDEPPASTPPPTSLPEIPAPNAAPPLPESTPGSAPQPLDRFGEEQLARQQDSRDSVDEGRLSARVVEFDFVGRNKLRVRLANGQVWVQNKSDRPNLYPRLRNLDGFSVELWRTSQGSYRMHVPEANRTIRIERLQ